MSSGERDELLPLDTYAGTENLREQGPTGRGRRLEEQGSAEYNLRTHLACSLELASLSNKQFGRWRREQLLRLISGWTQVRILPWNQLHVAQWQST